MQATGNSSHYMDSSLTGREYFTSLQSTSGKREDQFPVNIFGSLDREDLKLAFDSFDVAKRGKINIYALKICLQALCYDVSKKKIRELLPSNIETVSFNGFVEICAELEKTKNPVEEYRKAFHLFDVRGSGEITIQDLKAVSELIGEEYTDSQLEQMINEFDLDGDGKINEEEFIRIMRIASGDF